MSMRYNARLDRMIDLRKGHATHGIVDFIQDEIEFGARVALALDEEDQSWWVLHYAEVTGKECPGCLRCLRIDEDPI